MATYVVRCLDQAAWQRFQAGRRLFRTNENLRLGFARAFVC